VKLDQLKQHKKILLLGYGIEGQATERFLKKFHPSAEIGIADRKDDPNYLNRQRDYDLAIRTPLLRPKYVTIPYTTATNLFFANVPNTTIGITGTKGKSTVVSLLHHTLKKAGISSKLHGNIGSPMLDALTEGSSHEDVFVLELSSYQLEDIHYSPHVACLLNVYHELHNHDTYDEYFTAKSHITTFQTPNDHFFYNSSDERIVRLASSTRAHVHDFTHINIGDIFEPDSLGF
jgi:UDP-N-acetylmuramoylalanine--D-glutamate ligase